MPPILQTRDLHKTYERGASQVEVLKGINLNFEAAEQVVIIGASGAGKSTLLHLLGGLDLPTQGSVFYQGESLFEKSEAKLARFRNQVLGFIFQFHHLLPLFTALENVMMPCLIGGESKKLAREKAFSLLQKVGLEQRAEHRPSELSGGEQQRVAIARALVSNPRLVLADEPTGNLDTETSHRVFDQLIALNESLQTTLIVVTHNEELARRLKRCIRMRDGKVQDV